MSSSESEAWDRFVEAGIASGQTAGAAAKQADDLLNERRARGFNGPSSQRIQSLKLTPRTLNALLRMGIRTVADLVANSPDEIEHARQIGPAAMAEIRKAVKAAGHKFRGE